MCVCVMLMDPGKAALMSMLIARGKYLLSDALFMYEDPLLSFDCYLLSLQRWSSKRMVAPMPLF